MNRQHVGCCLLVVLSFIAPEICSASRPFQPAAWTASNLRPLSGLRLQDHMHVRKLLQVRLGAALSQHEIPCKCTPLGLPIIVFSADYGHITKTVK